MKKLLFMVMASYALTSSAQMRPSEDFIYRFDDSIVYANKVLIRPDLYGNLDIRADSRRVPINQIKFLNTKDGFFANIEKGSFIRTSYFAERIIEGRINIFHEVSNNFFDRYYWYGGAAPTTPNLRMYYNKGFGDLKKVKYSSLLADMSDHQESIDLLKGYKKSITTAKTLYITAGASVIAGLITFWTVGSNHKASFGKDFGKGPNFTPSYILLGAGTGLAIGGYATHISALRKFEAAIDNYNK